LKVFELGYTVNRACPRLLAYKIESATCTSRGSDMAIVHVKKQSGTEQ